MIDQGKSDVEKAAQLQWMKLFNYSNLYSAFPVPLYPPVITKFSVHVGN